MKDQELETWRREWQAQPDATMELIRRVERETVSLRMDQLVVFVPAAVATVATVIAATSRQIPPLLFAAGLWMFIIVGWVFTVRNRRGIWAPAVETPAAYLALSIERCRKRRREYRFGRVLAVLVTAFVLVGVYGGLKNAGALNVTGSSWILGATFTLTIGVVAFVLFRQNESRKKTETELAYLLDLQRQLNGPTAATDV